MRSLLALTLLCCPLLASAEKLNVKPGLWEITSSSKISGMPALPKELFDKLTPEQRAALEAQYKVEADAPPQVEVARECITERELENPFESSNPGECTQEIIRSTRTSQEVKLECVGEQKGSGTLRIATPNPESMSGVLEVSAGEAQTMSIKVDMKGRWLGPDCGEEADDDEEDDLEDADDVDTEEEDEDW